MDKHIKTNLCERFTLCSIDSATKRVTLLIKFKSVLYWTTVKALSMVLKRYQSHIGFVLSLLQMVCLSKQTCYLAELAPECNGQKFLIAQKIYTQLSSQCFVVGSFGAPTIYRGKNITIEVWTKINSISFKWLLYTMPKKPVSLIVDQAILIKSRICFIRFRDNHFVKSSRQLKCFRSLMCVKGDFS